MLPAEFGYDPLKTGKMLGLTGIAVTNTDPNAKGRAVVTSVAGSGSIVVPQPRVYKVDSEDFSLMPGEGVEMKYHMQKGAGWVYSWKADGKLLSELHGEPDQKPNKDYYESYELDDKAGKAESHGSFTAPSTGIPGWFWQNKGDKDVMFHLSVAGFFDSAKMYVYGKPEEVSVDDAKIVRSPEALDGAGRFHSWPDR